MNTYQLIAILFILEINFSCSDDDRVSQTQEVQNLQHKRQLLFMKWM